MMQEVPVTLVLTDPEDSRRSVLELSDALGALVGTVLVDERGTEVEVFAVRAE